MRTGIKNPTLDVLIGFSKYFKLFDRYAGESGPEQSLSDFQLRTRERQRRCTSPARARIHRRPRSTARTRENIEVVPIRAKAGYQSGYADPEFIKKLPTFQLPILLNDRKYRMFQTHGDSMLPIPDKAWVIGEYIGELVRHQGRTGLHRAHAGRRHRVQDRLQPVEEEKNLLLKSLSPNYPSPFEVPANQIREVWRALQLPQQRTPRNQNSAKTTSREKFRSPRAESGDADGVGMRCEDKER